MGGGALAFGNFRSTVVDDYDQAYAAANDAFTTLGAEYVVIQLVNDVLVFAPRTGQAVRLLGVNRADVQPFNLTTGSLGAAPNGLVESGSGQDDTRIPRRRRRQL